MSNNPEPKLEALCVPVKVAAELWMCSDSYVYKLIEQGRVRRVTLGESSGIRIPIEDVRALAEGRKVAS